MNENILIAGGSGMIGSHLTKALVQSGYRVSILTRTNKTSKSEELKYVYWDPSSNYFSKQLKDIHAVINLAGAGIADARWSARRKQAITSSRIDSTSFLADICRKQSWKPSVYIGASAIGFYGNRAEEWLTEDADAGEKGFLAETSVAWENAHNAWIPLVGRHAIFRIGIVLSSTGGALPKMSLPVRFGLNPVFGNGNQYYSWIHIDDLVRFFIFLLEDKNCEGAYNAVSPEPVIARDFVSEIQRQMKSRAWLFHVPAWILRIVLGEMADTVLWSQRISAERLLSTGYQFKFGNLEKALGELLG